MTGNITPRHPVVAAVVALSAAVAVIVDGGVGPAGEPARSEPAPPPAPTTVAMPTPPPLGWSDCGAARQCSTLVVPLDYAAPAGTHMGIALERRPAPDPRRRIGALVINPGGPGESGLRNFDKDLAVLPPGVLASFDVVTFDPRGVGASEGIHCAPDGYNGPEPDPVPQTPAAEQVLLAADRAYAASCAAGAGALLPHLGTVDVARDLEELRIALGEPRLTYLGLSYGTLLGLTYAGMFPTHVRAMVLDGPLDPSSGIADLAATQAAGFEDALTAFLGWCVGHPAACAWHPGADAHAAFRALADRVRARPLGAVGVSEFYTGTFGSLYSSTFWPGLGRALEGIQAGDGTKMLGLYRGYERVGDSSFDSDTNNAVTCLDHPVPRDPSAYFALAGRAAVVAPDFGPLFAWGALSCAVWPVPDASLRSPGPVRGGPAPILVVGTTGDPATPYAWARAVASQLDRGVLLTRRGTDHVAIFYSACVRSWDEAYLVALAEPPAGTTCP